MSRGGRGRGGGLGGGAGRIGAKDFEIEADLEDEITAYQNELGDGDDEWTKTLYPDMKVYLAPPPTEREKRLVGYFRQHRSAMRNGPFFLDGPTTGKRDAAEFNAFEDVPTYGNKRVRRTGGMPNLKKLPIVKELLPRELWDVISDGEEKEDGEAPKKNLNFLKKKRLDKLAQFDEDADDAADKDDEENLNENEDGGEDDIEELRDDDFSEDDDDLGNDYNAEQYFDNGDSIDDEGDGDGGGEDAWNDSDQDKAPAKAATRKPEAAIRPAGNEEEKEEEGGEEEGEEPDLKDEDEYAFAELEEEDDLAPIDGIRPIGMQARNHKTYQHISNPFCARTRAAAAADYLLWRQRQLTGKINMRKLGGVDEVTQRIVGNAEKHAERAGRRVAAAGRGGAMKGLRPQKQKRPSRWE